MAKKDDRPIDVGLAALSGNDEAAALAFWKKRLELIAAIPNEIARVGALTPQLRELTRMENEAERERLTRARIIAFAQLPADIRERVAQARRAAWDVDKTVLERDQALVDASVRSAHAKPS